MPASKLISSQLPNARVAENPLPAPAPHVAEDQSASVDVPAPVEDNASMANPPSELPSETPPGLDLLSRGIFNSDWRFSFRVFLFSIFAAPRLVAGEGRADERVEGASAIGWPPPGGFDRTPLMIFNNPCQKYLGLKKSGCGPN